MVDGTTHKRDLLSDPLWDGQDLGQPIPDSEHAVSVALPHWEHVVGYEEEDPRIMQALKCGYPRFFCHPRVNQIFAECEKRFAKEGEKCLAFPSPAAAQRCADYLKKSCDAETEINALGLNNIHAISFDARAMEAAREYWRYSGEIVSSRMAKATLEGKPAEETAGDAKRILKQRIARQAGQRERDVYLFPSGMSAIFALQRMIQSIFDGAPTVQLEFPYVDVLRVQRAFGKEVHFVPLMNEGSIDELGERAAKGKMAGVFTEIPSNPLMRCVNLHRLREVLQQCETPLIIDDTVGTSVNVDAFKYADAAPTSLTKFFGGVGDVMAGSVVLNSRSPYYSAFTEYMNTHYEDLLWEEDAAILEVESRDYPQRVERINQTTEALYEYLRTHSKVETVWHPKSETKAYYDQVKRKNGGYSGLLSILLKDAKNTAPRFYDALRVSKGPSLGTYYTLACPYMLLAHYKELDWAEEIGISRYLIRVSVGLEKAEDLIERFEEAFARS